MRLSPILVLLVLIVACHKPDPDDYKDQISVLKSAKTAKEKEKACKNLKRIGKRESAPGIAEALKSANSKIKGEIADVLGELKESSVAPALADAIDFAIQDADNRAAQDANAANREIARALGDIGNKAAVKSLVQLARTTKDDFVRVESVSALGKLKDPSSIAVLSEIASDQRISPLISKKALMALGQINDPSTLGTFLKMLFEERKGVPFFPESAFGIFLLGQVANDKILSVLKNEDKELQAWAAQRQISPATVLSRAAQVESDLRDARAVEPLIDLLNHGNENVRMHAAGTLGQMRAKEAAGPISDLLHEKAGDVRSVYVRALVQIGDESVISKLIDCSKSGPWSVREYCVVGVALLGGEKEIKNFDAFVKDEPELFDKECKSIGEDVDCRKEKAGNVDARTKSIIQYKKALETLAKCNDNKCLEEALKHPDPVVRVRAGYQLGQKKSAESIPALIALIKRAPVDAVDLDPRFAAICAVDWIISEDPKAMAAAKSEVPALEALIETEKERLLTQKSAEDVKRLAVRLARGGGPAK